MPDLLTPQALATAGPLVLETLFKHLLNPRAGAKKHNEARQDDLMYDEAFILMKTFLETATKYPVSGLQRFGLVRTPAPPWVGIHRVTIPQRTLINAADYLITALGGEEQAYKVVGGTKWWQVRAGPGVEAEWIVLKKDWKDYQRSQETSKGKEEEGVMGDDGGVDGSGHFRKEMNELRCMLYIHGGAYYWGSINTHRYTIWRYARKMHGRCFAVNYRKAPQYPFPCAIQDCLAAYLYLTNPPPGAQHNPVDPKNIVLAGDSAGGGLVLALLQILRDTEGLTLPAGAVLISPWSDLTHSFPSILENTATDIVPPYGFIHKPSSLWPPPPPQLTEVMQTGIRSKVKEAVHHLKPTKDEDGNRRPRSLSFLHRHNPDENEQLEQALGGRAGSSKQATKDQNQNRLKLKTSHPTKHVGDSGQEGDETLHPSADHGDLQHHPAPHGETDSPQSHANPALVFATLEARDKSRTDSKGATTLAQCNTPLELVAGKDEKVVVDTQIQLYATNAQLCHPWVSPILAYLGGLPPLLVCAGDHEVLRDEITYVAHKAANPEAYPIRDDMRALLPSLNGIEEKHGPTNVHFQIYDGSCHDLPLFSMTTPARGMFRAIASFARFCTPTAPGSLHINTPANSKLVAKSSASSLRNNASGGPMTDTPQSLSPVKARNDSLRADTLVIPRSVSPMAAEGSRASSRHSTTRGDHSDTEDAQSSRSLPRFRPDRGPAGDDAGPRFGAEEASKDSRAKPGEAGYSGIYDGENPYTDHMIRERVSTTGQCRPLEPASELAALQLPPDEVGTIKEGQATRYLNGQHLWDKKFHRTAKTVEKHRRKNLKAAKERDSRKLVRLWEDRIRKKDHDDEGWETDAERGIQEDSASEQRGVMDQSWSWEWALHGEAPPPSAIVSRRDFSEARSLALMADRMDDEHGAPVGGLSLWVGLATFFSNSQERNRAHEAVKQARQVSRQQQEQEAGRPNPELPKKSSRRFGSWFRSSSKRDVKHVETPETGTGTSTGTASPSHPSTPATTT